MYVKVIKIKLLKNFIRFKTLKLSFRIKFLKVKKIFTKDLSFFILSIIQNRISQDLTFYTLCNNTLIVL